jgi:PAS domain S-box-containing protein
MISPDIATETRFKYPDFLVDNGVKAVANVVILGGEGRPPFGILQIDSRVPRQFADDDTAFLRSYANLLAAAVDRLRVMGEMRDGQERLRLAMEAGRLGNWQLDLASGTMTHTPRIMEIFGNTDLSPTSDYKTLLRHILPEDRERVERTFREAVNTGKEWHVECRIRRTNDGRIRWIEMRGRAAGNQRNALPIDLSGIIADITERKTTEEELEEKVAQRTRELVEASGVRDTAERANRAKSRFLASMSHELRTPLNGVLGYAHLLHQEGGLSTTQSGRVDAMLGAGAHLLQMINRVLDFSEIEAGDIVLQPLKFDIRKAAKTCLDFVDPAAEAKGLCLGLIVAPDVPTHIISDLIRFRQILINLLGNAIKFTTAGSVELRLKVSSDGAGLRVEVADSGPGIPVDQCRRLFQDFDRLDTDADATEGAGLGFAISGRLATLMGSHLGYADNPSGGSVFWLELPLAAGIAPTASPPPVAVPGTSPAAAEAVPPDILRILVVDDTAMNVDITAAFLRAAGHEVICAGGGVEGVATAAGSDFNVILMDVRMPDVDGLEATRRIRLLTGRRGKVPIVALTAQAFSDQVAACREAGMDEHLAKPFTPKALLDAVVHAAR